MPKVNISNHICHKINRGGDVIKRFSIKETLRPNE